MKQLLAVLLLTFSTLVFAEDLVTPTDVGEIVLTEAPCSVPFKANSLRAYATEGLKIHEGCWYLEVAPDGKSASVNIYYFEIDATGVYNPAIFKKRDYI